MEDDTKDLAVLVVQKSCKKTNKLSKHKKKTLCSEALSKSSVSNNWIKYRSALGQPSFKLDIETHEKPIQRKKLKPSKVVALDCEMVANINGHDMLARVSIVDFNLNCIYDKYVKPTEDVVDYRTRFSGIRPKDIKDGEDLEVVQREIKQLLRDKILVGHGLRNDFNVLGFGHHAKLIRDTSLYKPFREVSDGKTPSLRKLAQHFLQEKIQEGEHSSVQDAAAAMKLYRKVKQLWENSLILDKSAAHNKK